MKNYLIEKKMGVKQRNNFRQRHRTRAHHKPCHIRGPIWNYYIQYYIQYIIISQKGNLVKWDFLPGNIKGIQYSVRRGINPQPTLRRNPFFNIYIYIQLSYSLFSPEVCWHPIFPNILKNPEHKVIIDKLDDSGILIRVMFWISSKENYLSMKSNVTETINLAFKQSEIHMAYPHLEIIKK